MDDCRRAAELTLITLGIDLDEQTVAINRDPEGRTKDHAIFMLCEILLSRVSGNKAHRWLGYAQAILVMLGECNLNTMKLLNKQASDEEKAA